MRRHIFILLLLLFLTGCSLLEGEVSSPEATQTAPSPTPESTPTLQATLQATEQPNLATQTTLNVWVLSEISTLSESPGGTILAEQLAAFETSHPNVVLNVETKSTSGQSSALNYLRSGRDVAPSILPDLIIIPSDSLVTAAAEELIYPLEEHISSEDVADLFPAASELAQVGGQLYGYPYALSNLGHMAYDSTVISGTVPVTWDDMILQEEVTFVFPAASVSGAELVLKLYLASGGAIVDDTGQPFLEVEPLANALTIISRARDADVLPNQINIMTSLSESWQAFVNGDASSVQTTEGQYNSERLSESDSDYAGIPGIDAPLPALVHGWTWAISTAEPSRQALAGELLNWLTEGPNVGEWSLAAAKLPGRRSAFEQWPVNDPYFVFVQNELERADPYPLSASNALLNVLSTAVLEVLTMAKSPQLAAEEAVASLQR